MGSIRRRLLQERIAGRIRFYDTRVRWREISPLAYVRMRDSLHASSLDLTEPVIAMRVLPHARGRTISKLRWHRGTNSFMVRLDMSRIQFAVVARALCGALLLTVAGSSLRAGATPTILFIAGEPSHGPGEHRFPAGCTLLATALNESGLEVEAIVSNGWPQPDVLAAATTVVIFSDGLERHVAAGHEDEVRRHVAAGKGLAVLHFALEASPGPLADLWLEALGGRFEVDWSVNPVWTLAETRLGSHAVTRGVTPFVIEDEWYFHLRFRPDIEPVLQALPPLSVLGADGPRSGNPAVRDELTRGVRQTLAWVYEQHGRRAFGFTGGHFHRNWAHDDFRRLVLNAIVWTAGLDVPEAGVNSRAAAIPRYPTIDEAIARGDEADVRTHLAADPARRDRGANASLTPLHQAILRNRVAIARLLLEAGADVEAVDGSKRTPLHLAVQRDNAELVAALLDRGARTDRLDQQGWTPLHHAAARDGVSIARALLDGGADANQRSELGGTPLHEAAASGSEAMVRLLLDHGVDPTVRSKTGVTARDIAREYGNAAALAVLSNR